MSTTKTQDDRRAKLLNNLAREIARYNNQNTIPRMGYEGIGYILTCLNMPKERDLFELEWRSTNHARVTLGEIKETLNL